MRRCNYVRFYDGFHHNLEETEEKNHFKLNEIEGVIDFCESTKDSLIIKLRDHLCPDNTNGKVIIWYFDKVMPLPAVCEQRLRCFYEETHKIRDAEKIDMDAYELLDNASSKFVIRRAAKHENYKFVGGG
ncbi:MAG: hypothetical protein Q8N63_08610 [Nanoarchaeota archaeon]|nr:hypothetical protein [Nanoarchaeota archaeon]